MFVNFHYDASGKLDELTVRRACETLGIDVSSSFADTLDDCVTQETQAIVERLQNKNRFTPPLQFVEKSCSNVLVP